MARANAVQAVMTAPDGYKITVAEPTRSLDQNSLLWPLLAKFSEQLKWPVNGIFTKLSPEDWKTLLTAAFRQEQQQMAQGLHGGFVFLGMRTSEMNKQEFSEFIEFLQATAALRGVNFD
jgi:hypothetical protein